MPCFHACEECSRVLEASGAFCPDHPNATILSVQEGPGRPPVPAKERRRSRGYSLSEQDAHEIRRLRARLGARSDADAIRIAVEHELARLDGEESG